MQIRMVFPSSIMVNGYTFAAAMKFSISERQVQRWALILNFLLSGICMGTWTSRIPTIKTDFGLNEAELGSLLLSMPIASTLGIPLSGWIVSRWESRKPLMFSTLVNIVCLIAIGFTKSYFILQLSIFLFAFAFRILNIAINTQSLVVQQLFEKRIVGMFHAFWSFGSLLGVGISTLMVKYQVPMADHMVYVSVGMFVMLMVSYPLMIRNDQSQSGNKLILKRPDSFMLILGVIALFAAMCEGSMFDWSGVYFKEIIGEEVFTLGYLTFMLSMSFSRFLSDRIIETLGSLKTYLMSGLVIALGIGLAVLFPSFWPAIIGFGLVGFGTSSMFPLTFSLVGKSKKYSPGMAISIVTTYSVVGFLAGPPLIGYLAYAFSLQKAFVLLIFAGIMIVLISRILRRFSV